MSAKIITIKEIPFKFVRFNDGSFQLLGSDYCEPELVAFIQNNLPEGINQIPKIIEIVEHLINEFKG